MPTMDLETYMVMRLVPGEERMSLRAFVVQMDTAPQRRTLGQWDQVRRNYEQA